MASGITGAESARRGVACGRCLLIHGEQTRAATAAAALPRLRYRQYFHFTSFSGYQRAWITARIISLPRELAVPLAGPRITTPRVFVGIGSADCLRERKARERRLRFYVEQPGPSLTL